MKDQLILSYFVIGMLMIGAVAYGQDVPQNSEINHSHKNNFKGEVK